MMPVPILRSIQVGVPAERGVEGADDPLERPWTSAIFKEPAHGPIALGLTNLEGDAQADLTNHGGPDKAVCVYSADHYWSWRRELEIGSLPFGAFGENFTIAGLVEQDVCIGDVWKIGDAEVEVSQPRRPCWKLARRWGRENLPARVVQTGRTGWYLRVRTPGTIEPGTTLTLLDRPQPEWTIADVNRVLYFEKDNWSDLGALVSLPALSAATRLTFEKRLLRAREAGQVSLDSAYVRPTYAD